MNDARFSISIRGCVGAVLLLMLTQFVLPNQVLAQDCIAFANNKVGDAMTVTATLTTTDPNEIGEQETAQFFSSGGELSALVTAYFIPQTFSYTATQANEAIQGVNSTHDGDESCIVTVTSNQPHFLSQSQKNFFTGVATGLAIPASAAGAVALLCTAGIVTGPICGLPAGLVFAALGTIGSVSAAIALDPPDPNFMQLATPVIRPVPAVPIGPGIPPAVVDAYNALFVNSVRLIGYEAALYTTLNRASGAAAAGDTFWLNKQVQFANGLEGQISAYFAKEATLLAGLQSALVTAGLTVTLTPGEVFFFESQLVSSGLPAQIVAFLQELGADPTTITTVTNVARVQDINAVAGPFTTRLADPALLSTLTNGAQLLAGACTGVGVIKGAFGKKIGQAGFDPQADLNGDGVVDIRDLAIAGRGLPAGTVCP